VDPVEQALAAWKIPNNWWPVPLLDALQAKDVTRIVPWVARCLLGCIQLHGYWARDSFVGEIQQVVETTSPEALQQLLAKYEQFGSRDKVWSSHIHPILAKRSLLEGDVRQLRHSAVWALILLAEHDVDNKNPAVRLVIDKYEEIVAERG
jgi:hypothetical protein